MNAADCLASALQTTLGMLQQTVQDFSDADLLVRPVPNANHAAWQLGHLIVAESNMLTRLGAPMPPLPQGFAERFSKEATRSDDPHRFGPKAELMDLFAKVRTTTVAFARGRSDEQLAAPTTGPMSAVAPTIAAFLQLQVTHMMMHVGQMQVIRRKLGKPILF